MDNSAGLKTPSQPPASAKKIEKTSPRRQWPVRTMEGGGGGGGGIHFSLLPPGPGSGRDYHSFDDDSDYASGLDSYPSTLLSSDVHTGFRSANGRRYVSRRQVEYTFPHDEEEEKRSNMLHHLWGLVLDGGLFRSPIGEEPAKILDVGTGTASWAIEVAERFPKAHVIGTDIAPSRHSWAPPNLDMQLEDVEDDWVFASDTFDLVHIRGMAGFISDWPRLLRQSFAALKPGGYLEFHDLSSPFECDDGSCAEDNVLKVWVREWEAGAALSGKAWNAVGPGMKDMLAGLGFEDVTADDYRLRATGRMPEDAKWREIGNLMYKQCLDGAEGITLDMFIRVLGWKMKDVEEFVARIKEEIQNPDINTYTRCHIVYARKPLR